MLAAKTYDFFAAIPILIDEDTEKEEEARHTSVYNEQVDED